MAVFFVFVALMLFIAGCVSMSYGAQKHKEFSNTDDKEKYYNSRVACGLLEAFGGLCYIFALILFFALLAIVCGVSAMFGI